MISRTGNRGFSLIEVLVASVILFAGLGAVLKAYSMAVQALGAASETLATSDLLREKAVSVDLQFIASPDAIPAQDGRERRGGVEYVWDMHTDRQVVTPLSAFQKTTIRIVRAQDGTPRFLDCERALFRDPP